MTRLIQLVGPWLRLCTKLCCAPSKLWWINHFFVVSCDEVTSIDNQNWLFMHVYVIDNHKHVLILLNL
jgi:hypothetical protein